MSSRARKRYRGLFGPGTKLSFMLSSSRMADRSGAVGAAAAPPPKGAWAPPAGAAAAGCPKKLPKAAELAAGADARAKRGADEAPPNSDAADAPPNSGAEEAPPNSEGADAGAAPNRFGCCWEGCEVLKEKGAAAALEAAPNRAAGGAGRNKCIREGLQGSGGSASKRLTG